ncbi:hypothetical protein PC39_14557 [Salinisphaera sp. PC39]|uniref:PACE efflux transporter n=1 Tax=Salinisphaera sp. PC39 TaxID=1304156 RepID=UPI00333FF0E9
MRSIADRIRHAVCFEVIGVLMVGPLASWAFDAELMRVGSLAIALSLVATAWNYVYNLWFDHAMWRMLGRVRKTLSERVLHAFIFEFGMLLLTLPPVMWWLDRGVIQALNMSLSLMVFYLVYTYVYNLAYDWLFPIREPA